MGDLQAYGPYFSRGNISARADVPTGSLVLPSWTRERDILEVDRRGWQQGGGPSWIRDSTAWNARTRKGSPRQAGWRRSLQVYGCSDMLAGRRIWDGSTKGALQRLE